MGKVGSTDGTQIAYERSGGGRPVIVVGGATCDRAMTRPTAEELAKHFAEHVVPPRYSYRCWRISSQTETAPATERGPERRRYEQ